MKNNWNSENYTENFAFVGDYGRDVTEAFDGISEQDKNKITDDAVEICRPKLCKNGEWIVDYVRLRMKTVKVR